MSFPSPARRATATSDLHARSFARFLQSDTGLDGVLRAHLAVTSIDGLVALTYQGHRFEAPRYDAAECLRRGHTFAAPLKALVRLAIWEGDEGARALCDLKEQEVYFGEVPLLTAHGCFVMAGVERAPLLTARDDGRGLRLRAAGEHLADAAVEGLAVVTEKARAYLEKCIARGAVEAVMPHDLLNARPLMRAFARLLEKTSRVVAVDAVNPLARAAQAWCFDVDDEGTRDALARSRSSPWITREGARVMLSPDAAVDDEGVLDADATGDTRPLAMRFGRDGDAWCRALPLAEASAAAGDGVTARAAAERGSARVSARVAGAVLCVNERRVWMREEGATEPTCVALATTRAPGVVTAFTLRPAVTAGQRVEAGDALATSAMGAGDGVAPGRHTAVTWSASLAPETCRVSARGAKALRTLHRTVIDVWVRDTRLGVQEVVRDVPGVEAHALRHLDASGIAALGATVEAGDVLVGVVSPCDDGAMRDEAVRATARATVTGVEMFLRRGRERCARHAAIVEAMVRDVEAERDELLAMLAAQGADEARCDEVSWRFRERAEGFERGDDLPPGVVGRTRIALLEERAVQCDDVLADGEGRRWRVCEVGGVEGAEVELAGDETDPVAYLMVLRAEAAKKRPARRTKRGA